MTIITVLFFFLGTLLGSFVGVIAERAYTGQSWRKGRSKCNSCCEYLSARDLIPVFSWLMHRGRCRTCGSRVPVLYVVYELLLGVAFAAAYAAFGLSLSLLLFIAALLLLAFITIYDLRHTIVPQIASTAFIILSLAFAWVWSGSMSLFLHTLLYAVGISLFFLLMYLFSRGRAMGLGDTPMAFGLSMLAGPAALPGFFFSFWIGGVIGILILVFRKGGPKMGIEVPFVPFMAIGFMLALFTQWNPLPF